NPGFVTMLGIVQTLLMLAMAGAISSQGGPLQRLFSIPLIIMLGVVMTGTVLFAQPPGASSDKHMRHWVLGVVHGLAQITLGGLGALLWLRLPPHNWEWPGPLVVAAVVYLPIIGFVSTQLCALYLLVASAFKVNVNELYAGQGIEDAKAFRRRPLAADAP